MFIIDKALQKRQQEGFPIRVALVGAGYSGRSIANQILTVIPGMRLVAISNRSVTAAERAYMEAGVAGVSFVETVSKLEEAVAKDMYVITDDAMLLCEGEGIDAVVDATGEVEFGSRVAMKAIENGKHLILMNVELDATVGPILKVYADRAGVVITNTDGDEPGVGMNLYRFVRTIGFQPVLAGNLKGFYDPYRTPDTQREFAETHNQNPRMMTSAVDGTKLSMELAVLANATGFKVDKRGMNGYRCAHVKDVIRYFRLEQLLDGGLVEYLLGAEPGNGAFVVGYSENPVMQQYMKYLKMGDGPLYVFYRPFHLPHLEIPLTVARAVLYQDATVTPMEGPACEVITVAKRNLKAGDVLDGIGGFTCYGLLENSEICRAENLLPMGLSQGCRMKRDFARDHTLTYDDVELPEARLCDKLLEAQDALFSPHSAPIRGKGVRP